MTEQPKKRSLKFWKRGPHTTESISNNVNTNRDIQDVGFYFAMGTSGTYVLQVTGWNSKEAQENFRFALELIKGHKA